MPTEGELAHDFMLTSDSGETARLSDIRGKPVVLSFVRRTTRPALDAARPRETHIDREADEVP